MSITVSKITLTHSGSRLLAQAMAAYQRLEPHQVRIAEGAAPATNPLRAITLEAAEEGALYNVFFGADGLTVEISEAGPLAPEYLPPEYPVPSPNEDIAAPTVPDPATSEDEHHLMAFDPELTSQTVRAPSSNEDTSAAPAVAPKAAS